MTQMEYITLKTPEGYLVGHARVREGAVSIHLREPMEGEAAVFTPSGIKFGAMGITRQFQEPIWGIALLQKGRMMAWGTGRRGNLTPEEMEQDLRMAGVGERAATAGVASSSKAPMEIPGNPQKGERIPSQENESARQNTIPRGLRIKRPRPKGIETGAQYQEQITHDPEDPTNRALARAENRMERETPASLRQGEFAYMAGMEQREPARRREDRAQGDQMPPAPDPVQQREISHQAGLDATGAARRNPVSPTIIASPDPESLMGSTPQSAQAYERQIISDPSDFTNRAVSRAERWKEQGQDPSAKPQGPEEGDRDQVIAFESIGEAPDGPQPKAQPARTYEIHFQTGMDPHRATESGGLRWQETTRPPIAPPPIQQGDPEEIRPSRFPVGAPSAAGQPRQAAMETAATLAPNLEIRPPVVPVPPLPSEELPGDGSDGAPGNMGRKAASEGGQAATDPDTEAFFALLRRSEEVYRSIAEPALAQAPEAVPASNGDRARTEPLPFARQGEHLSWQGEVNRILHGEGEDRQPIKNPFPHIFPNASFYQLSKGGVAQSLLGEWQQGGERILIHAVPGAYSPMPPAHLSDYTRFIRSRAGGFWVRLAGEGENEPN